MMKTELLRLSAKDREQMTIELWRSGKTEEEIAQEFGCSCRTVRKYLYERYEYNSPESDANTLRQLTYTLPAGFDWKWEVTCNRILRAYGKKTKPVPEHSKREEIRYWAQK